MSAGGREGRCSIRGALIRCVSALLCLPALFGTASAETIPQIVLGTNWLSAQVQPGGGLASEAASIATVFQNRTEAAQSLKLLGVLPGALLDAIDAEADSSTEYLARKVLALVAGGRDASAAINLLLLRQNTDGGFGGQSGFESNPLDTALALIAFKSVNQIGPVSRGLAYLQNAQTADGSYSAVGRADADVSAHAAIALRLYGSQFNLSSVAQKTVSYLESQRSATQLWGDSIFLTARVYGAVHDFLPLEPLATTVRDFLIARQTSDGSWDGGDPYSTALALRALVLTGSAPSNPALAVLKGKVIDAQTGQPLPGVAVQISGSASGSGTTSSTGSFEFRDLAPGSYALQFSLTDYYSLSVSTGAQAGQTQDLGTLQLSKGQAATTGTVRGVIKDASNGHPLGDVTVTVSSGQNGISDGSGNYQILNVPAGSIIVQATKTGYASVAGSGNLAGGGVMVFSPSLAPGTNNATATLMGIALRASDGMPLEAVSISVTGANTRFAITDATGEYSFTNLNSGLIQVQASKAGFDTVPGAITLVGNSTIVFSPRMYPSGTTPPDQGSSSITGVVVDAGTGQPLRGVQVSSSNGPTAVTNDTGRFTFQGSGTTQQLSFSVPGYRGGELALNWGLAGKNDIGEVRLVPLSQGALLPDLAVSRFLRQGLATDPQTLVASGTATVVVANIGSATTQSATSVTLFEDRDGNGLFDPAVDVALGSGAVPTGLGAGETPVSVPVSGTLSFRDNRLHALLDRDLLVTESNEANNVGFSSCLPYGLPFIDNFNDGNADGWQPLIGRGSTAATVVNGEYVRPSNGASYVGSTAWTDYSAEIKLRFPNGMGNDAGLVFRARNSADFHSLRMQSGLVRLMQFTNGGFSALATASINILNDPQRYHTIRVDVAGRWVRGYMNGQHLFEIENLGWDNGAVGMEQDGVLVHYDDVRVTPLVVSDDFNDGNANGWQPLAYGNSPASVVGGEYVRNGQGAATFGGRTWRNYTAETRLRFSQGIAADAGLVILAKDANNWAHVALNAETVSLKIRGIGMVRSAAISLPSDPEFWHTLKAEVVGNTVKVYANGQFVLEYDQLPWGNGAVGTIQDGGLVHFDDVRVTFATTSSAPDLSASLLRIQDGGTSPSAFTVRVGNGGGAAVAAGARVAFYDRVGTAKTLLSTALTTRALAPGQYEDVSSSYAGPLSALSEIVAVVDDNGAGVGTLGECEESNNSVSLPLSVVPGAFSIQATTDQTSYGPNADVVATATVTNLGSLARSAQVRFRIETGDGSAEVATLPLTASVMIGAAASAAVQATWNTGTIFTGAYRVRAELLDAAGAATAAAVAPFAIVSGNTQAATARAIVDKQSYLPSDTVRLTSRLTNTTENAPLDDLRATTSVLNPDGSVRFTRTEVVAQLAQGALKDYEYAVPLGFAAAGPYSAAVTLRTAAGAELASGSTAFAVQSSAATGSGLTGTIVAAPKSIPLGDPVTLNATVSNGGNSAQSALPLVIRIVDPGSQTVLAEFPRAVDLVQGSTLPLSQNWASSGAAGSTVVAVLSATVGGSSITLAQDTLTIAPPVVRLAGNVAVSPSPVPQGDAVALLETVQNTGFGAISGAVLTLSVTDTSTGQVVAQWSDSPTLAPGATFQFGRSFIPVGAVGTLFHVVLTSALNGVSTTLFQASFALALPPVRLDVSLENLREGRVLALVSCKADSDAIEDAACSAQRAAFLDAYLGALGATRLVTTNAADFERALRGGRYNVYWISGGAAKLHGTLAEELREAVFRGEALITDGVHDNRNHDLNPALGVEYKGKLDPTAQPITVISPIFAAGNLPTSGRPLKLVLSSGEAQAAFPDSANGPAIVSNAFGLGRGLMFGYDLVGSLMSQSSAAQDALVATGLGWLKPQSVDPSSAFAYEVLKARVQNVGAAVDLNATFTPPDGGVVLATGPAATPDASGRPVWRFSLESGAAQDLYVGVRLPGATGSYSASVTVESTRNGATSTHGTFNTGLTVEAADLVTQRTVSGLLSLLVASNDKADRDQAVGHIQSAQVRLAASDYAGAIGDLVSAGARLVKITSVDVGAYRVEVGRMLKEAQARWATAQP